MAKILWMHASIKYGKHIRCVCRVKWITADIFFSSSVPHKIHRIRIECISNSVDVNIVIYILFQFPLHIYTVSVVRACSRASILHEFCLCRSKKNWYYVFFLIFFISFIAFATCVSRYFADTSKRLPIGRSMCVWLYVLLLLFAMRPFPLYLKRERWAINTSSK